MSEQEVVAKKNAGLWIPGDIWEMMEIGALNAVEVMVVSYIDGLAKTEQGCWASNEHLARKFHLTNDHVRKIIKSLKNKEILLHVGVRVVKNRKYRILKTYWTDSTPSQNAGGRGVKSSQNAGGKPSQNAAHITKGTAKPSKQRVRTASASLPEEEPAVVGELTPGEKEEGRSTGRESRRCRQPGLVTEIKKKTKTKKKVDPKHVAAATKLNQSLHKNNRVRDNRGGWPGVFAALEKSIGKDYTEVLDWYCDHCSEEEERKCGLPSIQSASQFSRCYDWIRRQKEKMHKKEWDYTGSVIDGPSRKLTDWRDLQ